MISMNINKYCFNYEKIQYYKFANLDKLQIWDCHHVRELHLLNGKSLDKPIYRRQLLKNNEYYNRPSEEFIFLPPKIHHDIHQKAINGEIIKWRDLELLVEEYIDSIIQVGELFRFAKY